MKNIFAFCNQKGGVGKTTSVINIATLLGIKGYKVLLIDMDSQANATSGLGEEKPGIESTTYQLLVDNSNLEGLIRKTQWENLSLIPSSYDLSGAELELIHLEQREFQLKKNLSQLQSQFDVILIDCPPSLGLVTLNSLVASNYVIIPLQCEYYALEGLGQLLHTYQLVQTKLNSELEIGAVLLTMADMRTNLTQQVIQDVKEHFKDKVFESIIPRSVKLSEAPSFGKPAVAYEPQSRGAQAYFSAAEEFEAKFLQGTKKTQTEINKNIMPSQTQTANATPEA